MARLGSVERERVSSQATFPGPLPAKRKFLFVVNVDWFFVSHRLPIAKALVDQGHDVHIVAQITDKLPELERAGLIVHPIRLDRGSMNILGLLIYLFALMRLMSRLKPDLIHLVTIKPVLFGGLAARLVGVPNVVAAISGLGSTFQADGFLSTLRLKAVVLLYRVALNHKRLKVIFQNGNDLKILKENTGLTDNEIETIRGSGVDLEQYNPGPASPDSDAQPVALFAARLLHEKGVADFVEAARLVKTDPDLALSPRFVLVGRPDPENPSSVALGEIDGWVKEGIIEYWGHRPDMPQVLAQADLVVFPSFYGEGLPKILIEAASSGKAVITTDHPGCRDAIENGKTGLLVPIKNAKALTEAIKLLLKNRDRREALGRAGRALAEKEFDIRVVVRRHIEIYGKLLFPNEID